MAKKHFKEFAQKALSGADENLQKASAVARKAVAGVNDGLDAAKAGLQKASLTNRLSKSINLCIKELEKENKANSADAIHESTEALINRLNEICDIIKDNPYECKTKIESEIDDLMRIRKDMIESSKSNEEMLEMTVMSKRYDESIKALLKTISEIEDEREEYAE